jgi:hypothetical protein
LAPLDGARINTLHQAHDGVTECTSNEGLPSLKISLGYGPQAKFPIRKGAHRWLASYCGTRSLTAHDSDLVSRPSGAQVQLKTAFNFGHNAAKGMDRS